ncbi:hypothetical protein [Flavobacterium sp. YJ01]|uniref:hypothetical protein n=1 Tax=unclassified Flavobacterium TaxID=196869 RepID=UPI0023E3EC47|nr:hypothetical protein [Flavobacterium sp. YJ01]WET04766.1 hypothetical protein P0R33_10590 [Flavobacterium sp. YJ01]
MKNHKKKNILILIFGLFLNISNLLSQNTKEESIYNLFDNTVGIENLGISNGYAYKDTYNTIDNNSAYYLSNDFRKGSVVYDGQTYINANLKYNTHKDELIFSPHGESKYSSISLIQDKTSSFILNGRNFVNLNRKISTLPELTTGYYEVTALRDGFNFYIKHFKKLENKTVDNKVYSNFIENNTYFVFYKNTYYTCNSKSEILKIFPNQKKQINDFYAMNRETRKSDYDQFMINLFKHINASLLLTEK